MSFPRLFLLLGISVILVAAPARAADQPAPKTRAALGPVWTVAYSPDGRLLATGSGTEADAGVLAVWDLPAGTTRLWAEHPRGVRAVAFSPDGRTVATGCWDNLIRLYNVPTGKVGATLKGHTGLVNSLAFSSDGKTLASAGLEKLVILWDVEKGKEARRRTGHEDWVLSVAFFPGGKLLASSSKDGTARVWDVATGKELRALKCPGVPLESVAVSPDGQTLATGGWDWMVRLWDADSGTERIVLRGHTMGVLGIAFSPDGKLLASVSGNYNRPVGGEGKLWALPDGEERATLRGHKNSIWSIRFAPDGRSLATASRDQTVKLWESATGQERLTLANGLTKADKAEARLSEKDLEEIWKVLLAAEAAPASGALARLVRSPEQTVPWLGGRLQAEPVADEAKEKRVRELIAKLDDDDFEARERADAELGKLGPVAAPALRKALEGKLSVEVRQRIVNLLAKSGKPGSDPERLRALRAIEALELMNTAEARKLLHQLARGAPQAPLTQEAEASYRRLTKEP